MPGLSLKPEGAATFAPVKGLFVWPVPKEGSVSLTPARLSMLLEGIDWRAPQRTQPTLAG